MTSAPQEHDFVTLGSQLELESAIIALRRDEVLMPGGHRALRDVVEHLGAVAVVALSQANTRGVQEPHITMVRQYRHPLGKRLLEIPAGLLDIAGESELSAAKRELQEEAGLGASSWNLLVDIATAPGFSDEAVRIFVAQGLYGLERLTETGDEEADLELITLPLAQAVELIFAGEIVNSIAVAGILAAHHAVSNALTLPSADKTFELRPTALADRRAGKQDLKGVDQ